MNKGIFIILLTLITFSIQAQLDSTFKKPSGSYFENKNTSKVKFVESQDHFMVNFTLDNLREGSKDSFYNGNVFNPNLGIYLFYDIPIGKSPISIAPGLGMTFSRIGLDNSVLKQDSMGTTFVNKKDYDLFKTTTNNATYDYSSFYTSWLDMPIELRYRSNPINGRSRFKVAVGIRAGLKIGSNAKVGYIDNKMQKDLVNRQSPFSDLNTFRYGATFRIGYGAFNLFGYYGLNQLIKDTKNNNNLDLRQYSIGISITGM